jgi:uncharacterized OsmC-like protein
MGVELRSVEVEVQADFDARAEYGVAGGRPGYEQVRCVVTVESGASEEEVRRVIERAHAGSSYLHIWREPQDVRVELRVRGGE